MAAIAIPGQVLGTLSTHIPGSGTHVSNSNIYASIFGTSVTTPAVSSAGKPMISIVRATPPQASLNPNKPSSLPVVGSTVLCRIIRVQQRQAIVSILVVDASSSSAITTYPTITSEDLQFQAILRKEDVRAYEKDKIILNDMFRVGDIVRATVISLGDERNYYISTAGNDFGVVVATSEQGNAMVPTSWREMRDVVTGKGEARKVAKPS